MSKPNYKKALNNHCLNIIRFENMMDKIMTMPEGRERGEAIAQLLNTLSFVNQEIMHFTLGYSFKQIENRYKKPPRKV